MSERELTPAQAEEVRRRLADARHTDPMPEDVAARMDAVLAGLSRERVDGHGSSEVPRPAEVESPAREAPATGDELAARRRRRWAAGLLAAAAVVLAGFTLPTVIGGGAAEDESSAGSAAEQPSTAQEEAPQPGSSGDPEADAGSDAAIESIDGQVPRVRADRLGADVARVVADQPRSARRSTAQGLPADWCGPRDAWGEGATSPVRYVDAGGRPERAVLVLRPPEQGVRQALVFRCGEDDPVGSTDVPVE